ncbi:MAG: type II toxin-antitoxin system prevent-host-death family antitoxin [Patescibacteria group bacterium]
MTIDTKSLGGTPSISAMELRSQPGTILDRVYYRGETIIVKRSGEPRAAIVPLNELEQIRRARIRAKEELFVQIGKIRKALAKEKPEKIEKIISQALEATQNNPSS